MGDIFATESTNEPSDEFQSNRLVLDGDAAPMDTDIERLVEVHTKSLKIMSVSLNFVVNTVLYYYSVC